MNQSLNNKLTRIDETLSIMKDNLKLNKNEIIENLATATNLHSLANIFIQENEPEAKEGIWIQADSETYPYDTIRIDGDVIIPGQWRNDKSVNICADNKISKYVFFGNCLYFVHPSTNYLHKYDLQTGKQTTIVSSRVTGSNAVSGMIMDDKYFYIWGNMTLYRYDMNGNCLNTFNMGLYPYSVCKLNESPMLYIISEYMIHQYNIETNEIIQVGSINSRSYTYNAIMLNDTQILCLGGTLNWGIYNGIFDLTTQTYTSIPSLDRIFGTGQSAILGMHEGYIYTQILTASSS